VSPRGRAEAQQNDQTGKGAHDATEPTHDPSSVDPPILCDGA
jgi:hypothetical protein